MLSLPLEPRTAARHLLVARMRVAVFNEDQPRDEQGRWTSGLSFIGDVYERYPQSPDTKARGDRDVTTVKQGLKRQGRLNPDGTVSLYHVTIADPKSIMERGLVPGFEAPAGQDWAADYSAHSTYFYLDKGVAIDHAEQGGEGHAVIEARVPITKWTLQRFLPDEDTSPNVDRGPETLVEGGTVAFIGGVPASAVKLLKLIRAATFNEDQPRDEQGRWTDGGASSVMTPEGSTTWYKGMYAHDYTKEVRRGKDLIDPGPVINPEDINRPSDFPTFDSYDTKGFKIRGFFSHDPDIAAKFVEPFTSGGAVYKVEIGARPDRTFTIDAKGKHAGLIQFGTTGQHFRDVARSGKYDVIIIKNTKDEGHIAVVLGGSKIRNKIGLRAAEIRMLGFDPSQPRDEQGRWTDSGSEHYDRVVLPHGTREGINVAWDDHPEYPGYSYKKEMRAVHPDEPHVGADVTAAVSQGKGIVDTSPENARVSAKALKDWSKGTTKEYNAGESPHHDLIREAADRHFGIESGGVHNERRRSQEEYEEHAKSLVNAIAEGRPEQPTLWRGIGDTYAERLAAATPGDEVRFSLGSTSRDAQAASIYGSSTLLRIEPGSRGIANRKYFEHDQEVITGGHFQILRLDKTERKNFDGTPRPVTIITLRQIRTPKW